MSYGTDAPAYRDPSLAGDKTSTLGQERCVIKNEHFFRGRLVIPVTGAGKAGNFLSSGNPWAERNCRRR